MRSRIAKPALPRRGHGSRARPAFAGLLALSCVGESNAGDGRGRADAGAPAVDGGRRADFGPAGDADGATADGVGVDAARDAAAEDAWLPDAGAGDAPDRAGPTLVAIAAPEPATVPCGDAVVARGTAEDPSGVAAVTLLLTGPEDAPAVYLVAQPDGDSPTSFEFAAETILSPFQPAGRYRFAFLSLTDGADPANATEYRAGDEDLPAGLADLALDVTCDSSDVTPPTLLSLCAPVPGSADAPAGCGDDVTLCGTARDEVAGISGVAIVMAGPAGALLFLSDFDDYSPGEAEFTLRGTLSPWAPSGTWRFDSLDLSDAASNVASYRAGDEGLPALLAGLELVVDCADADTAPPELTLVEAPDPDPVALGGEVAVAGHASDDVSGLALVRFSFLSPGGETWVELWDFEPSEDGSFVATGSIPTEAPTGAWPFFSLELVDGAGNETSLSAGDPDLPVPLRDYALNVE